MFNRTSSKYDQVEEDARRLADSISELMAEDNGEGQNRQKSEKMKEAIDSSKQRLREAGKYSREKGKEIDRFAHENVWTTVGIAAGVGAVVGMLMSKMKNK